MAKLWHTDERTGRRFRNIPLNLADRRALIAQPLTAARHQQLLQLESEFEILWQHGLIFEDGQPR